MKAKLKDLLQRSIEAGSLKIYNRAWALLKEFSHQTHLGVQFPVTVPELALFIAWLADKKYAAATISSYVSAIGYQHKMRSLSNPASAFLIKRLLLATRKTEPHSDLRLPITHSVLTCLLLHLPLVAQPGYQLKLFRAMFLLAYHAFLRVGEMTHSTHNLKIDDIDIQKGSVVIRFASFKHSQQPVTITIRATSENCPVEALAHYIQLRGKAAGCLFMLNSKPVPRARFVAVLQQTVRMAKLPTDRFNTHSFRIGAATDAAVAGRSDAQIRSLGRWHSDAFQKYIRVRD